MVCGTGTLGARQKRQPSKKPQLKRNKKKDEVVVVSPALLVYSGDHAQGFFQQHTNQLQSQ
jgi:hypothetical protein